MGYLHPIMTALMVSCGVTGALVLVVLYWDLLLFVATARHGDDEQQQAETHS